MEITIGNSRDLHSVIAPIWTLFCLQIHEKACERSVSCDVWLIHFCFHTTCSSSLCSRFLWFLKWLVLLHGSAERSTERTTGAAFSQRQTKLLQPAKPFCVYLYTCMSSEAVEVEIALCLFYGETVHSSVWLNTGSATQTLITKTVFALFFFFYCSETMKLWY